MSILVYRHYPPPPLVCALTQQSLPPTAPPTMPAHPRVECSNKGICNKATGECHCFENYDGKACERTSCPNDCSGRGVCLDQKALAEAEGATYELPWDGEKAMGCKCDPGYRGPDCSQKECPSGDDILGGEGVFVCQSRISQISESQICKLTHVFASPVHKLRRSRRGKRLLRTRQLQLHVGTVCLL